MTIDYFMTSLSPWTYLGHETVQKVARRNGVDLAIRPVNLPDVFEHSGALPLAKRSAARQRYRFIELQRMAELRALPLNLKPKFFPVDPTLADLTIIAVGHAGGDALAHAGRILAACWAQERDIADEAVLVDLLKKGGNDADAIMSVARSDAAKAERAQNTRDAMAIDSMGVPVYALNGEPFWGQDRIELLEAALRSGRGPFKPL